MPEVKDILAARRDVHGDFVESSVTQGRIISELESTPGWSRCSYAQRRALHMIVEKLTRIVWGNPDEPDHWIDIAGYSTLGGKSIDCCACNNTLSDKFREEGV